MSSRDSVHIMLLYFWFVEDQKCGDIALSGFKVHGCLIRENLDAGQGAKKQITTGMKGKTHFVFVFVICLC